MDLVVVVEPLLEGQGRFSVRLKADDVFLDQ
jgi:hypothetical protein